MSDLFDRGGRCKIADGPTGVLTVERYGVVGIIVGGSGFHSIRLTKAEIDRMIAALTEARRSAS